MGNEGNLIMPSVAIHPPKTPVTKGSQGIAKATLPNVCKMPGPPAPFIPSPLPNIAKSGTSPKGYSKKVKIESNTVAIRGATFKSMGDVASKGTGGGLISANTHGIAKFITPGSMNVKIEGKSVHLLGEPMLNNCGASGSPPNTGATLVGLGQASQKPPKPMLECGECGSYTKLRKKRAAPDYERDHIPSKAAVLKAAKDKRPNMSKAEIKCVKRKVTARGITVALPKSSHRKFSPTCGGKNTKTQISDDAKDLATARDRDIKDMQEHLDNTKSPCAAAYREAAKKVKEHDNEKVIDDAIKECTGG